MSRFTAAAIRSARILSGLILVAASVLLFSPALFAGSATAAPQLLPYTVSIVAGGGTLGISTAKYTVGNYCGTNTTTAPSGSPPAPLSGWPTALSTVGDGCLATQVYIESPNATAVDSEGNVFIVDYTNRLIRRVDAHTGIITTVAGATTTATITAPASNPAGTPAAPAACPYGGQTTSDAWGDGCLATSVLMDNPQGIALDAEGNIWFTDYTLDAVREVAKSTGILSTVVNTTFTAGYNADNVGYTTSGITAALGRLYHPDGLTFDKYGNLYIADNYNSVVDVVNLGITPVTVAGISIPAGNIYTIAGLGCPYATLTPFCDQSAYYGKTPAAGSSIASTSAKLDSPYQIAVDNSGNIYIADEYNYDVRVINPAGSLSTFANNSFTRMTSLSRGPALTTDLGSVYGVATDALGNVYISTYLATSPNWANIIARVDQATGEIYPIAGQTVTAVPTADTAQTGATYCATKTDVIGDGCPGTKATFWKLYLPVVDSTGNVYVTDAGDNLIRKISVGTQFPAVVAGTGNSLMQSLDVHFGSGDTPLGTAPNYTGAFTFPNPDTFQGFNLGTASCTANSDTTTDCVLPVTFEPSAGSVGLLTAPLTVTSAKGLVSNFALTGTGLGPVLAVDPGSLSDEASLTGANSVAVDLGNNVYATATGTNSVVKVDPFGNITTLASGTASADAATVDAAGNIYVALANGTIMELPGGVATNATQITSGFTTPSGLAVDSYGNLFVSDSAANTVTEILAGTGAQVVLANETTVPTLSVPTGLAVDSYGNVFVANTNGNSIIELPFAPDSTPVTLGSGLSAPQGVALDAAGSLYIADKGNKRIVYLPNESGTLNAADQIAIVTGLGAPTGVAIYTDGLLYVSDSTNNTIYQIVRYNATVNLGNALTAIGSQAPATNTGAADIISMGNQPAIFGSKFFTESSPLSNSENGSFALSPSSIPNSSLFPAAGWGVSLTPSFTPQALGTLNATFTFDSTSPASQPLLTVSGDGIQPHDTTTALISTPTPAGGWTYGQTILVNVVVSVNTGLPAATGNVSLYQDGGATPIATLAVIPGSASGVACSSTATCQSTAQFSVSGLKAGAHSFSAAYGGDSESSSSNTGAMSLPVNQAPLTVTVNPASANFDAPIPNPVTTGTLGGVENGDLIGVSYSTTATAGSPTGQYLISAQVTGGALANYTVTIEPNGPGGVAGGTFTISKDTTVTSLGTSATSVNSTTQVTLTATVSNQTAYSIVFIPTGSVTFFNTVGTVTTQIGAGQINPATGIATYVTTFAVVGSSTNNSVTAVYSGDTDFVTSTSAPLVITSGTPTFTLTPGTKSSLTVAPGQSGLMSFTLTPAYGYNGIITFSCAGASASVSCSFSPSSISPNGSTTPILVAATFNTTQSVSPQSFNRRPSGILGSSKLPFTLAAIPGFALLFGVSRLRRKLLRSYGFLLFAVLCLCGLGLTGCGGINSTPGTPAGNETITVVATGTGGSFASVTEQFNVSLTVQ
jgi:sugar lactone lactonase YvrE